MTRPFRLLLVYANLPMDNVIPVGVSSLLGALRRADIAADLFDTTFYRTREKTSDEERVQMLQVRPFSYADFGVRYHDGDVEEDFRARLRDGAYDLVGISLVEPTYALGMRLAGHAAAAGIPVIAGGVFANLNPELLIRQPQVAMVCTGEGEECLPQVCRALAGGTTLRGIANLWYKDGGTVMRNPRRVLDLTALPRLDFSAYAPERFFRPMGGKIYRMVPVEFSRGCPFSCSYCADHRLAALAGGGGAWYRRKPVAQVLDELRDYRDRYDVGYFYFVSETFLAMPPAEFDEFARGYRDIRVPFWFNTRPETISEPAVARLREIGCHRISVGVEHGNEEFRRRVLRRAVSNRRIIEACALLNKHGIGYSVNNIIGFPGETRDLVFDTIALNRAIRADSHGAYLYTPYRGTDLFDECVRQGLITPENIAGDVHLDMAANCSRIPDAELRGLLRTFALYVALPERDFPTIRAAEQDDAVFAALAERFRTEIWRLLPARA